MPYAVRPNWPNISYLINEAYNALVKAGTKAYCGNLYASTNSDSMATEMSHNVTVADMSHFEEHIALSAAEERPYILGMSVTWEDLSQRASGSSYFTHFDQDPYHADYRNIG